jgi:CubicO group peptidase (beta-lactamase class C family)
MSVLQPVLVSPASFGHDGASGGIRWIDPVRDAVVAFVSNRHFQLGDRRRGEGTGCYRPFPAARFTFGECTGSRCDDPRPTPRAAGDKGAGLQRGALATGAYRIDLKEAR